MERTTPGYFLLIRVIMFLRATPILVIRISSPAKQQSSNGNSSEGPGGSSKETAAPQALSGLPIILSPESLELNYLQLAKIMPARAQLMAVTT